MSTAGEKTTTSFRTENHRVLSISTSTSALNLKLNGTKLTRIYDRKILGHDSTPSHSKITFIGDWQAVTVIIVYSNLHVIYSFEILDW